MEIKPAWSEAPQNFQVTELETKTAQRSLKEPQLLTSHLETTEYREESISAPPTESLQFASSSAVTSRKSLASSQTARIQKESDFLKCTCCSVPRPSDPFAHFCQECGSPIPPVPVRRFPAPEGAQGKVICRACGTGNPLHHKHCVTCESKLPETQTPMFRGDTPQPFPNQQGKTIACSKCGRVNHCDTSFCDWCGAKFGPLPCYFTCFKCGTTNQPYARFCGSCGEPQARVDTHNSMLMRAGDSVSSEAKGFQAEAAWQPLPISLSKSRVDLNQRKDKGTQTIGLFYPSSKLLKKKELEMVLQKEMLEKMSDHKPLLTAISPGRGYWRKQLDHVCAHLRSYAQNNLEFRALIGEPRMGKITSATVHEDDCKVTITLNYALAINKDTLASKPVKFSTVTEGRDGQDGSQANFAGEENHNLSHSRGKTKHTKSRKLTEKEDKLPPESRQLLKELGPNEEGRIALVEQLFDGAQQYCSP
ncbi:double zinc ribbon and ankyrin repeat-containing protein 1-like isoform X1 [Rhea pennata]|uniref:double zinc ribbon and ankyrin repeat-containing protein 1-like isoform X1 n=1 Tax=Rhea pennata TaxID=8795 RepID=UPI002E26D9AA